MFLSPQLHRPPPRRIGGARKIGGVMNSCLKVTTQEAAN